MSEQYNKRSPEEIEERRRVIELHESRRVSDLGRVSIPSEDLDWLYSQVKELIALVEEII